MLTFNLVKVGRTGSTESAALPLKTEKGANIRSAKFPAVSDA